MTSDDFLGAILRDVRRHEFPGYVDRTGEELEADLAAHAAVVIAGSMDTGGKITVGCSKIGGKPDLPEGMPWPFEERRPKAPLAFLAQVNFEEVHPHDLANKLPARGILWVFTIANCRYDSSVEEAVAESVCRHGGRGGGAVRLLGKANFFREENFDAFDADAEEVLLEIDGWAAARYVFGEGCFTWTITRDQLHAGALDQGWLTFEPGT